VDYFLFYQKKDMAYAKEYNPIRTYKRQIYQFKYLGLWNKTM